jgi:hypothetical protein
MWFRCETHPSPANTYYARSLEIFALRASQREKARARAHTTMEKICTARERERDENFCSPGYKLNERRRENTRWASTLYTLRHSTVTNNTKCTCACTHQTVISSSGRAKKNKWRGSEAYNQLDGLLQAPGGTRPAFIAARGVRAAMQPGKRDPLRFTRSTRTHMPHHQTSSPPNAPTQTSALFLAAVKSTCRLLCCERSFHASSRHANEKCWLSAPPGVGVAPLWACKVSEFSVMGSKRIKKLIRRV